MKLMESARMSYRFAMGLLKSRNWAQSIRLTSLFPAAWYFGNMHGLGFDLITKNR
jgi:hypothetical protein